MTHAPGLYPNMPAAEYHSLPQHIGSGGFKLLQRSPLHFWTASPMNPDYQSSEPTRNMLSGAAFHTALFEPHLFAETYAVKPDISANSTVGQMLAEALADEDAFTARYVALPEGLSKTTKEGKALVSEIEADGTRKAVEPEKLAEVMAMLPKLRGKVLLPREMLAEVCQMAEVSSDHPLMHRIRAARKNGARVHNECSLLWADASGAPCKARFDLMVEPCAEFPRGLILDAKSTDDASPESFGRTCWNLAMHIQVAHYSSGFMHHFGTEDRPEWIWLAQERDDPYACAVYQATHEQYEYGLRTILPLLETYAECLATDNWPGYTDAIQPVALPGYAERAMTAEHDEEITEISYV